MLSISLSLSHTIWVLASRRLQLQQMAVLLLCATYFKYSFNSDSFSQALLTGRITVSNERPKIKERSSEVRQWFSVCKQYYSSFHDDLFTFFGRNIDTGKKIGHVWGCRGRIQTSRWISKWWKVYQVLVSSNQWERKKTFKWHSIYFPPLHKKVKYRRIMQQDEFSFGTSFRIHLRNSV